MIIPDSKKAVGIIVSKIGKDGKERQGEMKSEDSMDDSDSVLKAIAEDLLMAVESKSSHDVMLALKAFAHEIQMEDEEQDEEME